MPRLNSRSLRASSRGRSTPLRILFNTCNGVGFGHQIRSLNLARALQKSARDARFLFLTQAVDASPIRDAGFSHVRYPILRTLQDPKTKNAYLELATDVVAAFGPHLYIQDGLFTDDFFGH